MRSPMPFNHGLVDEGDGVIFRLRMTDYQFTRFLRSPRHFV